MKSHVAFLVCIALAAAGCSGDATPIAPTASPSSLAAMTGGLGVQPPTVPSLGNSVAAHLCRNNYENMVRADGTPFNSFSECLTYGAQGGTYGGGHFTYTLTVTGTDVGDFGWSVQTSQLITVTTSFNSFQSAWSSAGCTISLVTINNPDTTNPYVETAFSPYCDAGSGSGGFGQTFWNAGPFDHTGVYTPSGVVTPPVWTLTITQQ